MHEQNIDVAKMMYSWEIVLSYVWWPPTGYTGTTRGGDLIEDVWLPRMRVGAGVQMYRKPCILLVPAEVEI